MDGTDRDAREGRRFQSAYPIRIEKEGLPITFSGETLNLSLRGACIATHAPFRVGDTVTLRIYPPGGHTVTGTSRVAWVETRPDSLGYRYALGLVCRPGRPPRGS